MEIARYDFILAADATTDKVLTYRVKNGAPVDLTGMGAVLSLKDRMGGEITLDTANGGIELGGASGTITILRSHPAWPKTPGKYSYRLKLVEGSKNAPKLFGEISLV